MKTKHLILILFIFIFGASCKTPMKSTKQTETTELSAGTKTEEKKENKTVSIDTTKTDGGKIIITKIEFWEPEENPPEENTKNKNYKDLKLNNSIKSFEQIIIENNTTKKGKTEIKTNEEIKATEQSETIINEKSKSNEKPARDPKRWRYIFYIILIFAFGIGFIYFSIKNKF